MNRDVSASDFRSLASHFAKIGKRLADVAAKMEEAGKESVSVEANQLFNTYKTKVKQAADSVCNAALVKVAQHVQEEEERAEMAAAVIVQKKSVKK